MNTEIQNTRTENAEKQLAPTKLDELAHEWQKQKNLEASARLTRVALEKEMQALLPEKEEGTITEKQNYFSVSVKYGFIRKIELEKLDELYQNKELQPSLALAFVSKPSIDLSALRKIEEAQPEVYAQIAQAISTKPSKPSISIKQL